MGIIEGNGGLVLLWSSECVFVNQLRIAINRYESTVALQWTHIHHSTIVALEKFIDVINILFFTIVTGTRYVIFPFFLYFVISKTATLVSP